MWLAPGPQIEFIPKDSIKKGIVNAWINAATNIAKRKAKQVNQKNNMPENAIEQTAWWYNYFFPEWQLTTQWQQNSLVGTWAMAWIPTWPWIWNIPAVTSDVPAADAQVTPVTTTTPKTTAPKQITTPEQQQQGPAEDIVNWEIPDSWKKEEEPEVIEEIPEQPFGAEQPWQTWKIYWRELWTDSNGWDFAFWETTLADPYSIEAQMYTSRKNNYNALQSLDSYSAAVMIASWQTPYGEQAMYDLQMYNPEKYNQIQQYVEEIRAGDTINAIASWNTTYWTTLAQTTEESIDNDKSTFVNKNSTIRTADTVSSYLDNKLESSQTATTAKQQMMIYKSQIADLQAELEDLPNKAKKAFKWDVPDYFYKAYISNNSQRIQSEIDKLESKYTWLADIYKTELAQAQWETEMEFKYRQFAETQNQNAFDQWYKMAQLEQNSVQWSKDSKWNLFAYKIVNWQVVKLSDGTAYQNYNSTVNSLVTKASSMIWQDFGECEKFTDRFAYDAAWVTMVWLTKGSAATTAAEKAWYATQFEVFSDYIPEVWDVAVFTNNGTNRVSEKRWHTMYVTWYDPNTNIVTLVWSNYLGDGRVYTQDYNLETFYAHGWQWFWNPYKYAQWSSALQNQTSSVYLNPMEPIVDDLISWGNLSVSQMTTLSRFRNSYQKLYEAKQEWYIDSLLANGAVWWFIRDLDLNFRTIEKTAKKKGETVVNILIEEITSAVAKNVADEDAYSAYMAILWVIETKLREESWAKINQWEWKQEFLQYLPEASDSMELKKRKLRSLENYLRGYAKQWGITWDQYIPLFDDLWDSNRSID